MTDRKHIYAALAKFQSRIGAVKKDAQNPHLKNRYATLEAVLAAVRPILSESGLVLVQHGDRIEDGLLQVTTTLAHAESGADMSSTIQVPIGAKRDAQAVGSALTYGRRYSLMSMLGLAETDDDGAATTRPNDNVAKFQAALRKSGIKRASDALDVIRENGAHEVPLIDRAEDMSRYLAGLSDDVLRDHVDTLLAHSGKGATDELREAAGVGNG
jgi:hypothetical protein